MAHLSRPEERADDLAGLDEAFGGGPKGPRMRMLVAKDGLSVVEQLKNILSVNFMRVLDLFRVWDEDGNHQVSATEFRRAIPVLGLKVDREDVDKLFSDFDLDGSGEIDYNELLKQLRPDIELDEALRVGAMGEIEMASKNKIAMRTGLDENVSKVFGTALRIDAESDQPIVEQLAKALSAPTVLARAIDIFHDWDEDGSGTVSKREFHRALPMLGLSVAKAEAEALFDLFDSDGSGTIEYGELKRQLRKHGGGRSSSKASSMPRLPQLGKSTANTAAGASSTAAGLSRVKNALSEELQAKAQLLKLQRQLARAERATALEAAKAKKLAEGEAVRYDTSRRVGRDLLAKIAAIEPASKDECLRLATLVEEAAKRSSKISDAARLGGGQWYNMFREMDGDHSGRISFLELKKLVRRVLGIDGSVVSDGKLKALWRALDEDNSGFISMGEFARWARLPETAIKENGDAAAAEGGGGGGGGGSGGGAAIAPADGSSSPGGAPSAAPRSSADNASRQLLESGVEALADEDALADLSRLFNARLHALPYELREWIQLWRKMGGDASPSITLRAFERAVRRLLRIDRATLPDKKLHALWLRLDDDLDGGIVAGDFGRFMRKAAKADVMGLGAIGGGGLGGGSSSVGAAPLHDADWRPVMRRSVAEGDADAFEEATKKAVEGELRRAERAKAKLLAEARRLELLLTERGKEPGKLTPRLPPIKLPPGPAGSATTTTTAAASAPATIKRPAAASKSDPAGAGGRNNGDEAGAGAVGVKSAASPGTSPPAVTIRRDAEGKSLVGAFKQPTAPPAGVPPKRRRPKGPSRDTLKAYGALLSESGSAGAVAKAYGGMGRLPRLVGAPGAPVGAPETALPQFVQAEAEAPTAGDILRVANSY